MKRALRVVAGLVVGAIILTGIAVVALEVAVSRGALTSEIDAALERATGRVVNQGAFSVRLGLRPTIAMADATVANIPGAPGAHFARIGRLEVTLALLPLLSGRIDIDRLALADAEIILERDAQGRANWAFGGAEAGGGRGISIETVEIASSRILMPGGPVAELDIGSLTLKRETPADPLDLQGRIRVDGEALTIAMRIGAEAGAALPIDATLAGQGLRVALRGDWPQGADAPGWTLSIDAEGEGAAVQRMARRFGRALPAFGTVSLKAVLGPGTPTPTVSDLTLRIGASDLGGVLPGLTIARAELRAATFDGHATLTAQGRRGHADLGLTATLPSLRRLASWEDGATVPVEAVLTSGRARLQVSGPLRRDLDLAPTVFDARLTTPDFALLGPVLGVTLPRVTGVTARARMSGLTGPELRLQALSVTADALAMDGDLTIATAARTAFRGQLAAERLDLDRLGGGGAARQAAAGRLVPDIDLPLDALRGTDAALRLSATSVIAGGITWRDVTATVALTQGRLVIDPLSVTIPGGPVAGRAALDAAARPARAELRLDSRGRGLDLAALRRGFGVPTGFDGSAELAFTLRGEGATTRALAASLSGEAGAAMVGGRFTGATALRIGPDLARVLLPRGTPAGGVALRCLALRLNAESGLVSSETLLVAGDFGRIDGSLAINLRDEAIAARLLPDVHLMGVTVRAPVTIGGTLANPRMDVDPAAAVARVLADTVANRLWRSSTVEYLRDVTGGAPPGGDCGPALTLARLGRAGPMPQAAAAPIPLVPREVQGAVRGVFRGIGNVLGGGD